MVELQMEARKSLGFKIHVLEPFVFENVFVLTEAASVEFKMLEILLSRRAKPLKLFPFRDFCLLTGCSESQKRKCVMFM